MSVGHVVAADRQDAGVERRAVREEGEVDRAGADVGDRDAELLLGLGQDGLGRRQRGRHELVDLDARPRRRISVRFWTAVADAVTMWVSTSSRIALIPSGSLTPSWPSTDEAAGLDVEDLAVRRDRDRPGDLGRPVDVLAADLAIVGR